MPFQYNSDSGNIAVMKTMLKCTTVIRLHVIYYIFQKELTDGYILHTLIFAGKFTSPFFHIVINLLEYWSRIWLSLICIILQTNKQISL